MRFPFRVRVSDEEIRKAVRAALREDINRGDATTLSVVPPHARAVARVRIKQRGVVAGLKVFRAALKSYDTRTTVRFHCRDGDSLPEGSVIAVARGRAASLLTPERVALNFLQHLSGIATETAAFVKKVKGTGVKIIDTRKTTPMLRKLEKYAVLTGGGFNHRPTLSDLIMIKDNHIKAAGGIREAVIRAEAGQSGGGAAGIPVEVEVGPGVDLRELEDIRVDIVMLDNYSLAGLRKAVKFVRGLPYRPLVEVSGGVRLENVREIADCGPDLISVGHITHSAPSLDIAMDFGEQP
jgi:nicotinate-nucleotide pyrophosphorylase (carboxylating)